ncbi:natterin-4-like [Thalassophryne amazonica]|nr:natterin-4-like [Thalassophryne amazonica]
MRFYLSVVFTILVMAADHTRDCEPLTETVRLPSVKVSKEIKETQISTVAEEPAPSAQIAFHKALIDGSTSRSDSHVPPYTFDDNPNLEWQLFNGSLPNGAVGIWNSYTNRYDYVCRAYDGCESGFYSSDFGKCLFPSYPLLLITQSFYILVNKDDFVFLEWKWGSGGSVPQNSIRTCF